MSESRRIAWAAHDHNIQFVPHGWNTVVGLAADLQLSAAVPIARYVEYLTPSPYIEHLAAEPFRLDARRAVDRFPNDRAWESKSTAIGSNGIRRPIVNWK